MPEATSIPFARKIARRMKDNLVSPPKIMEAPEGWNPDASVFHMQDKAGNLFAISVVKVPAR